jgi:hypothetical protein
VLKIHELPEEEAFVDKAAGPLEVENSDALANAEVTTVSEQECRVTVHH